MENTAIIVIDMQKGFNSAPVWHLPEAIAFFLNAKEFQHRIFTKFSCNGNDFFKNELGWDRIKVSPETDIVSELDKYPTKIIEKNTYSAFSDNVLDQYLDINNIKSVYLCGVDTNICVTAMAIHLFDRQIKPIVLADLSGSHSGVEYHTAALESLRKIVGKHNVVNTIDILHPEEVPLYPSLTALSE